MNCLIYTKCTQVLLAFAISVLINTKPLFSQTPYMVINVDGTYQTWFLVSHDEFDVPEINENMWRKPFPWGNVAKNEYYMYFSSTNNYGWEYSQAFNTGILKLTARNEQVTGHWGCCCPDGSNDIDNCIQLDGLPNLRTFNYTSGGIYSNDRWKFGIFEINCKMPSGDGLFPAFWLYGDSENEIDVFENIMDCPNYTSWDIHWDDEPDYQLGDWVHVPNANFADWHTFSMWWHPNVIEWNFKDQGTYYNYASTLIYQEDPVHLVKPMNIIATMQIPNTCPNGVNCNALCGNIGPSTPFPAEFKINFIRVWKPFICNSTNPNLTLCSWVRPSTDEVLIKTAKTITVDGGPGCNTQITDGKTEFWGNTAVTLKIGFHASASDASFRFKAAVIGIPDQDIYCLPESFYNYEGMSGEMVQEGDIQPQKQNSADYKQMSMHNPQESSYEVVKYGNVELIPDLQIKNQYENTQDEQVFDIFMNPNPVKDGLILVSITNAIKYPIYMEITDMLGKSVKAFTCTSSSYTIDVSNFKPGVYQIIAVEGRNRVIKKFVVL